MRLILFAHGSRDARWQAAVEGLAATVRLRTGDESIAVAYLEHLTPTLPDAVDRAVTDGADRIRVLPLFLAPGVHISRDLESLAAQIRRRHPAVELDVLPPVGSDRRFEAFVGTLAADALGQPPAAT